MQKQSTMLKRKPARYVNNIASEMAHGALISGLEILDKWSEISNKKGIRECLLFSNMSSSIIVRHRPGDGQKSEEKGEAKWRPARGRFYMSEHITRIMFVLGQRQECHTARNQYADVKDNISFRHFFHPVSRQGVDEAGKHGQSSHHPNCCISSNLIVEISSNSNSSEKHLSSAIF
jgi:hypothetical protein